MPIATQTILQDKGTGAISLYCFHNYNNPKSKISSNALTRCSNWRQHLDMDIRASSTQNLRLLDKKNTIQKN